MRRLTKQWGDNPAVPANINYDFLLGLNKKTADGVQAVVDRLAAYEDTGLEPVEVKEQESAYFELMTRTYGSFCQKIGSWLQAEKEGRLVVLPCLKGVPLYVLTGDGIERTKCRKIVFMERSGKPFPVVYAHVPNIPSGIAHWEFWNIDFGKTVFLTRKEAEAALKKREEI